MALSSSEIKDEEALEVGLLATCRICYQCDGEEDEDLISPCMCKGSHLFVHRSCLDHWRSIKKGFDFSHCTTCKAQFHLRVVELEEDVRRKIKIRLYIARDVIFGLLALQTVIGILGGISYLADKHKYIRDLFMDDFSIFVIYYSTGVMVFCVLISTVAFIVIVFAIDDNGEIGCCSRSDMDLGFWLLFGIFFCFYVISGGLLFVHVALYGAITLIQWILNRHNSILGKKELTKV